MRQRTIQCQSCGGSVSLQFARVFGSQDDEVYGCLNCATEEELKSGAGASPGGLSVTSSNTQAIVCTGTPTNERDRLKQPEDSAEAPSMNEQGSIVRSSPGEDPTEDKGEIIDDQRFAGILG